MTNINETIKIESHRDCKRCKGTGTAENTWIWNDATQKGYHGSAPCEPCGATGKIVKPDFDAIFQTITKGAKGTTKRSFRASKPKFQNEMRNPEEGRAYFVWRMVRFHGGKDVTMPVIASMCVTYDPYEKELDSFASLIARQCFGTDMAAAFRWMNALGHDISVPENQPATAFSGGPVADHNKPASEQPELFQ